MLELTSTENLLYFSELKSLRHIKIKDFDYIDNINDIFDPKLIV